MATMEQARAVIEWSERGWTAVRFPNTTMEEMRIGGPVFLTNNQQRLIMVDNDGQAYEVNAEVLRQGQALELPPARPKMGA